MKRIVYSAAMLLTLLSTACGGGNKEVSELPQIDVNTNYPEKEICLQDVAEVSYVPLETTDDVLLDGGTIVEVLSSEGIVCVSDNKVYMFHPDGKLRSILDKKGGGPGEYHYLSYTDVDWERQEIYVHNESHKMVFVYSLDGTFKHQYDIDVRIRQKDMLNDRQGHLIFYREYTGGVVKGQIEPYRPLVRMSLADGKVDSLTWQKQYHINKEVKAKFGDRSVTMVLPVPALTRLGDEAYVSEVSSDTIYRLMGDNLEPFIARTPSVQDEDCKYLLYLQGITPRHYLLRFQAKVVGESNTVGDMVYYDDVVTKSVMYEPVTGNICIPKFSNRDHASLVSYDGLTFNGCDAHTAYLKFEAFELVEALEAGELGGELKTIAEGLKEDDNPVLMVVKFKE